MPVTQPKFATRAVENGPMNILRITAALFVDWDDAPQNMIERALYGVTSIGHQAVVVFFVLKRLDQLTPVDR